MFDMPDWFQRYQSKDAWGNAIGAPTPAAALAVPGINPAAPVNTSQNSGGNYNDMDNVPYDPTKGVNNSSQAMRGAPMPPPAPAPARAPLNILPPPRPGGNWDTTAALEGDPAGQPEWATPQAQGAAAAEDRQIGPGSWFDPSKMGKMIDPHSLIGKMMAMRNPGAAPKAQQPDQGLLSGLFADGGMFGRDPTTPNNTIGGLW